MYVFLLLLKKKRMGWLTIRILQDIIDCKIKQVTTMKINLLSHVKHTCLLNLALLLLSSLIQICRRKIGKAAGIFG